MSLTDRIGRALGAAATAFRQAPVPEPRSEPELEEQFQEAAGTTIDPDEDEWRRLTGDSRRDLNPVTHRRMRKLALYQWQTNLIANRLIELPLAFLLAEGVKLTVANEDAQKWLDAFWNDPINNMDLKLPKKLRELALFGEQCWPAFTNEHNGHVRLGYLDPELIETVVTDPDNCEQPIGIVTVKGSKSRARRYRVIVNGPEDVFTQRTQEIRKTFTDGECFYFKVNDLSNGTRGQSDLLAHIDWCDMYEEQVFGEAERSAHTRAFVWDVTLKGATEETVKDRAKKITTPGAGSVRVHNDAEEWNAVTPDLKHGDASVGARLIRNHILGGGTIPEHWFGGGGDVNRAAASEMGDPTFKVFTMRQKLWKHILQEVASFVIMRRLDPTGQSAFDPSEPDPDLTPECSFPEMVARDTSKYAAALQQVVAAAAVAVDRSLFSKALGMKLIGQVAAQLGVECDVEEELAAALEDAQRRRLEDVIEDGPDDPAATAEEPTTNPKVPVDEQN